MKTLSMTQEMRQKVRWGSGVLLVLILGLFVYAKVFTPMSEDRAQSLLEKGLTSGFFSTNGRLSIADTFHENCHRHPCWHQLC